MIKQRAVAAEHARKLSRVEVAIRVSRCRRPCWRIRAALARSATWSGMSPWWACRHRRMPRQLPPLRCQT